MNGAEIGAWAGAATVIANGAVWIAKRLTTRAVKRSEDDADRDAWTRRLVDEQMALRESDRTDCTERINVLTGRLDSVEDRAAKAEAKVDECEGKHRRILEDRVNDIAARHAIVRQLRDVTAKYDELRGIVEVIQELPPTVPPPRIRMSGEDP